MNLNLSSSRYFLKMSDLEYLCTWNTTLNRSLIVWLQTSHNLTIINMSCLLYLGFDISKSEFNQRISRHFGSSCKSNVELMFFILSDNCINIILNWCHCNNIKYFSGYCCWSYFHIEGVLIYNGSLSHWSNFESESVCIVRISKYSLNIGNDSFS